MATALRELQQARRNNDNCLDAICKAMDPSAWIGRHRLIEAFKTRDVAACYDVSLMIHLVLEEMGKQGSHVVGFLSMDSKLPSFGVVHEGEIFTLEKHDWNRVEAFQRLLRSENTGDRLHNIYPPLTMKELLSEWIDKARGRKRRNKKPQVKE